MHLRQSGFSYSAGRSFIKIKERLQKFNETGDLKYIHQYKINKACF